MLSAKRSEERPAAHGRREQGPPKLARCLNVRSTFEELSPHAGMGMSFPPEHKARTHIVSPVYFQLFLHLGSDQVPDFPKARLVPSPSPYFVPGLPHVVMIELGQALAPYQDYHMLLLALAGYSQGHPQEPQAAPRSPAVLGRDEARPGVRRNHVAAT